MLSAMYGLFVSGPVHFFNFPAFGPLGNRTHYLPFTVPRSLGGCSRISWALILLRWTGRLNSVITTTKSLPLSYWAIKLVYIFFEMYTNYATLFTSSFRQFLQRPFFVFLSLLHFIHLIILIFLLPLFLIYI